MDMNNGRFIHYKIGINTIQKEHAIIFSHFKECFDRLNNETEIATTLNLIFDLLIQHFRNEEKFMIFIDYPYYKNHHSEHLKLESHFRNTIKNKEPNFLQSKFLVAGLQECFLRHIDEHDKQIESFYIKK